jgi:tetratricopeptide (TPR) repeat protein
VAEGLAVTARLEKERAPTYWRFVFSVLDGEATLERFELPFAGTTLGAWLGERIFANTYAGAIPQDGEGAASDGDAGVLLAPVIILFLAGSLFLLTRRRRGKGPAAGRGLIILFLCLLAALVALLPRLSGQTAQEAAAQAADPFADRVRLHLCMREGRLAEAELLARRLLTAADRPEDVLRDFVARQYVLASIGREKLDQAASYLEAQLAGGAPVRRAFALHWGAHVAERQGRFLKAASYLEQLRDILGDDDLLFVRTASALADAGRMPEALAALSRALAVNRESLDALLLRARLQIRRKDYDAAAADLRRVKAMGAIYPELLRTDPDFKKLRTFEQYADIFRSN